MTTSVAEWVDGFDRHLACLDVLSLGDLQSACDLARGKLDAIEARRLAAEVGADGDTGRARKMAGRSGRRSKRTARAAARRAAAVSRNQQLADDLESGDLSSEQLDAIADATASDETAATDTDFIEAIKKRNADQARQLAARRRHQRKEAESEHTKQRRLRRASTWKDFESGLSILQLAGDDATIEQLWNRTVAEEKRLHEADGGRAVAHALDETGAHTHKGRSRVPGPPLDRRRAALMCARRRRRPVRVSLRPASPRACRIPR